MSAAPRTPAPLSILADQVELIPVGTVRERLRRALDVLHAASLIYWAPAIGEATEKIAGAIATLDSFAADAQAAPRSWIVERLEREL